MPTRIKEINGNEYLYYVYYENGKKKDVYCGLASKPESKKKLLEQELKQLKVQKKNISQKVIETEFKLQEYA